MLVSTDLHLTDKPSDLYRFDIFDSLLGAVEENEDIALLGDIADKKDKHSAQLVNDIIYHLKRLTTDKHRVFILCGNHDMPVEGTPYWAFLSHIPDIKFILNPLVHNRMVFLPYTKDASDWPRLLKHAGKTDVIFMHQTVTGARGDNGHVLTNDRMPPLPTDIPIYSGDIHVPQKIGPVTYIGAPHPIKFGDDHLYRILRLNEDDFSIQEEIKLTSIQKRILTVNSLDDLKNTDLSRGDQVRLRFGMANTKDWPQTEHAISAWAEKVGIDLVSTEVSLVSAGTDKPGQDLEDPADIMAAFALGQGLGPGIAAAGHAILAGVQQAVLKRPGAALAKGTGARQIDLVSLDVGNIGTFSYPPTHIPFGEAEGLCLMTGRNEVDPDLGANDCGKSTLWNAIRFALYSSTASGGKGNQITRWNEKKGFAQVTLNVNGEPFHITRFTKPDHLEINDKDATQETVNELLRLNADQFDQAIMFSQGGKLFYDLPQPARAELFDQILNLQLWLDCSQQASSDVKEKKTKINEQERLVAALVGEQKGLGNEDALKRKSDEWESKQKETIEEKISQLEILAADVDRVEKEYKTAKDLRDSIALPDTTKQHALATKRGEVLSLVVVARKEIDGLELAKLDIERLGPVCGTCKQKVDAKHKQAHIDVYINSLTNLDKERKKQDASLSLIDKQIKDLRIKTEQDQIARDRAQKVFQNVLLRNADATRNFDQLEKRIEELHNEENPYLGMIEDLRKRKAEVERRLTGANLALKRMNGELLAINYWPVGFKRIRTFLTERVLEALSVEVQSSAQLLGLRDWIFSFEHDAEAARPAIHIRTENKASPEGWGLWGGGVTTRLRASVTIGMSNLIRRMAGVAYNFEIWDEPATHLSDEGVEDLIQCLAYRAGSTNRTIWMIEHRALQSSDFNETWVVRKTAEGAVVEKV